MENILDVANLVLASSLRMSIPIILAAVGATFSVRVGVVAFGCEGMMITGAFCGVVGAIVTGSIWIGLLFAIFGGVLMSLLHAFLHVTHRVNVVLSGLSVNLLGLGITKLLLKVVWGSNSYSPSIESFKVINFAWLDDIPILDALFNNQYAIFYIMIVAVVLSYIFVYKTSFGLRMRMVGESPEAAHSIGINTVKYKYIGVILSGVLCGLAGAYLSMARLDMFVANMTAGRGYIAMVVCTLAKANPLAAALAGLFFGFFDSVQTLFQGVNFPSQILMAVPYAFTLIASLLNIGKLRGPGGVGKHFDS